MERSPSAFGWHMSPAFLISQGGVPPKIPRLHLFYDLRHRERGNNFTEALRVLCREGQWLSPVS